jgi:chromosome segregation ATPase
MIESSIIITVVPPIVTGVFAYLIARKKNILSEKINKAKIDAEIQTQALTIVRGVRNDMRDEFKREIESLKDDNNRLRNQVLDTESSIKKLNTQLAASDLLVDTLQKEIAALRNTIEIYEKEIARLRK